MDSEMIERVARAFLTEPRKRNWPFVITPEQAEVLARAAIEAMLEPTEAMYDAGDEFVGVHGDAGDAEKVWKAMIDAALAQLTEEEVG